MTAMTIFFSKLLATFFYVGYLPFAPGSMATALGVALVYYFSQHMASYCFVFLFLSISGFYVCGKMEEIAQKKDPSCVVLDEVAGTMIAFFLLPMTPSVMITAFFIFRAFDMFKIYPAFQLEKLGGGRGIMLDDIVAGLYTNVVMHAALQLKAFF